MTQCVCHFNGRHIAIIKKDKLHRHAGPLQALRQRTYIGLIGTACSPEITCRPSVVVLPVRLEAFGAPALPAPMHRKPAHAVASDCHGIAACRSKAFHVVQNGGKPSDGSECRRIVCFQRVSPGFTVLINDFEHGSLGRGCGQKDNNPLIVQSLLPDSLLHIGYVCIKIRSQVRRPREIHE